LTEYAAGQDMLPPQRGNCLIKLMFLEWAASLTAAFFDLHS
jgi:hypothetical protein